MLLSPTPCNPKAQKFKLIFAWRSHYALISRVLGMNTFFNEESWKGGFDAANSELAL